MSDSVPLYRNRLLAGLLPQDLALLGPLDHVVLPPRHVLEKADTDVENVYFIEAGVASVVARTDGKREIEIGIIGPEGMTGMSLLMADLRSPFETFMQVEGSGYAISADRLAEAVTRSEAIRWRFMRHVRAFHIQVASTAISNGNSKLEERLARWLLMVGDRTGPSFNITHELLATMLAVRRSGVTLGLQKLEGRGLIRTSRGTVSILDRPGLTIAARGAYGLAEREYERLFGRATA